MAKNTNKTQTTVGQSLADKRKQIKKLDTEVITAELPTTSKESNITKSKLSDMRLDQFIDTFPEREQGLFFYHWINNGLNARTAYRACYPNALDSTVDTNAYRLLNSIDKRIRTRAWLESKGLNEDVYFSKLRQGLNDEDNKTMKLFLDKLGKILEVEEDKAQVQIAGNNLQVNLVSYLEAPETSPSELNTPKN